MNTFIIMQKYSLILLIALCSFSKNALSQSTDRKTWLACLDKIAKPVLTNMAENRLKEKMPVVLSPIIDNAESRKQVAYLEAFGRLMCGIAPWLNLEGGSNEEVALRNQYRQLTLKALANAVDPAAKDYLRWNGGQPLVDASFLAFALIRCPWLWEHTDSKVKEQVITAFKNTRTTVPGYNNWILFSGMIEAFFCKYDMEYDALRIEYGIREFASHWYVGDGLFSDGADYHWDYYNSYVIQPYLATIVEVLNKKNKSYGWFAPRLDQITKRYAEIQERMINTDGSFPVTGRSICYRGGAFHHLADMALREQLPASLKPAQVRGALTAVIKKTMDAPGTFTSDGWLNLGLHGHQPGLAERYITTGSLYLCSFILLPLGLPETNAFWSSAPEPWTSVKIWNGQDVPADHALELK
jgi:hypothetical protein